MWIDNAENVVDYVPRDCKNARYDDVDNVELDEFVPFE